MKKYGRDLTTGDVVTMWPGAGPVELLVIQGAPEYGDPARAVKVIDMHRQTTTEIRIFQYDAEYEVRDPVNLTPAQKYAEALVELARRVAAKPHAQGHDTLDLANALLKAIEPPEPVTVDEVLAALVNAEPSLPAGPRCRPLLDILERARRAGQVGQ